MLSEDMVRQILKKKKWSKKFVFRRYPIIHLKMDNVWILYIVCLFVHMPLFQFQEPVL